MLIESPSACIQLKTKERQAGMSENDLQTPHCDFPRAYRQFGRVKKEYESSRPAGGIIGIRDWRVQLLLNPTWKRMWSDKDSDSKGDGKEKEILV